ncbi:hypothetical protein CHUAL_003571 [Chamberlinius hualienensis]
MMDSKSLFKRTGLDGVVKVFRFYGFNFASTDAKTGHNKLQKPTNKIIISVNYLIYVLALVGQLNNLWKFYRKNDTTTKKIQSPFILADTIKRFILLIIYYETCAKSDKWAKFLKELATKIDEIQPEAKRLKIASVIKTYAKWGVVIYVAIVMSLFCIWSSIFNPKQWSTPGKYAVMIGVMALPIVEAFSALLSITMIIICELLVILTDFENRIEEVHNMDSSILFDRTGFSSIVKMFKIFGFKFDNRKVEIDGHHLQKTTCKPITSAYFVMYIMAIITNVYFSWNELILRNVLEQKSQSPSLISELFDRFCMLIIYYRMCVQSDRWAALLHNLAAKVDKIQPENRRIKVVKRIKKYARWGIISCGAIGLYSVCTTYVFLSRAYWYSRSVTLLQYYTCVFWNITLPILDAFTGWLAIGLIIICELLVTLIDCNLHLRHINNTDQRALIKRHQLTYINMSELVLKVEELSSKFMLITLILELLYVISTTTLYNITLHTSTLAATTSRIVYICFAFVLKAMAFSHVNDKVNIVLIK